MRARLARWESDVVEAPVMAIGAGAETGVAIRFAGGAVERFDVACSAMGVDVRLPGVAGPDVTADGRVVTGAGQETSVPALYAVGDVVTGLNQIGVAMAQGEAAAVAAHTRLRRAEGLAAG